MTTGFIKQTLIYVISMEFPPRETSPAKSEEKRMFSQARKKTVKKHHKLTQNSVSFSCQSKQDSRCCINFPHELTSQILTNQSVKNGRRA